MIPNTRARDEKAGYGRIGALVYTVIEVEVCAATEIARAEGIRRLTSKTERRAGGMRREEEEEWTEHRLD